LIDAFVRVLKRFPDTRLDIIGPVGPTPREYVLDLSQQPRVQQLGRYWNDNYAVVLEQMLPKPVSARVTFRGRVPHYDLPGEYAAADLLVFPSIWDEPSGNPPIEAMAAGTPVAPR
jgi:glycosyltransferase involved in cell wall biosynthesis